MNEKRREDIFARKASSKKSGLLAANDWQEPYRGTTQVIITEDTDTQAAVTTNYR